MKILILLLLLFIQNTLSIYNLIVKKCEGFNEPVIDLMRYQYDYIHYPIYCPTNKKYNFNNIKYMYYSLSHNWFACHEDFKNMNMSNNDKNHYLWKSIWDNYGSCTTYDMYNYFNKTIVFFYQNYDYYKKCIKNENYCSKLFDSKFNPKKVIVKYYLQ